MSLKCTVSRDRTKIQWHYLFPVLYGTHDLKGRNLMLAGPDASKIEHVASLWCTQAHSAFYF